MTQADGVRAWWSALDEVDRRRVLRLGDDDLLAEDLATGLAMHGVTVVPLDRSPVDGRPSGWAPPDVLLDLLVEVRAS
ncbi:hypothetical protein [Kineococcus rhizosphaerae]|uniref:Uncharacterized protein n=1 Tax=Kineococcus rhizosphaerae TaxID=559628 RepID=A0A2T0QLN0_9ACTN|nr:hypothetical protein [Kineococcus rhizosphaerae]PRY05389.1 hypothetical protein CLV37_1391 [Kineococcus rhizosphaerae]